LEMLSNENSPVVLVTGAACRIGAAIVRCFAQNGWRTVIHCRHSREAGESLLSELGGRAGGHLLLQQDLLEEGAAQLLLDLAVRHYGRLDCLINNASVYRRSAMAEVSAEMLAAAYAINFTAPFQLMQEFHRVCGGGSIVNLLDQRINNVDPSAGAYALAKKSLRDATEACALEWAPGIRVNAVAPGIVLPPPELSPETSMRRILQYVPMREASSPEELAKACLFLAESQTITGLTLYVDGGMHLRNGSLGEKNHWGQK
jgi:pteridine reductase